MCYKASSPVRSPAEDDAADEHAAHVTPLDSGQERQTFAH